jgi:hypothetical protein
MLVQIAAGSTLYPSVTGPIVLIVAAIFVAFGPGGWTPCGQADPRFRHGKPSRHTSQFETCPRYSSTDRKSRMPALA